MPWNYNGNTTPMAVRNLLLDAIPSTTDDDSADGRPSPEQNDTEYPKFTVTLANRKRIHELRMARLCGVIDGDMTCNRMPPTNWHGKQRAHTPSVGLQYDSVEFGFDSGMTVRYRIFGKNTHPLLYPSGAKVQKTAGGPGVHSATYNGVTTISVRRPSTNSIKRAFPCRFESVRAISTSKNAASNPDDYPFIWLYKFVEVVPDIDASRMFFAQQDVLGWTRAEGYALNLCEMHFTNEPGNSFPNDKIAPNFLFDGTELQLRGMNGTQILQDMVLPTDPRGYGICYEIYNRAGLSSYYIFAPNGVDVRCQTQVTPVAPAPWQSMGISGVANPSGEVFTGDIMGA